MAITYITENVNLPRRLKKRQISKWIKEIIHMHGKKTGDIAYVFCDDERILDINTRYLKHTYYTDIITFDYTEGDTVFGDIFISLDTVKDNAVRYKTNFDEELRRVIIHGILHLCGYEDNTRVRKKDMRKREDEAMDLFVRRRSDEI